MSDEPLSEDIDTGELLEDLDLEGELIDHLQANDERGIGERLGGAAGEVIGREFGKVLGERIIDPLLGDRAADEDEPSEEDEETKDDADEDDEDATLADADDLFEAVSEVLDASSDGDETPNLERREDLDQLSYRELQQMAKEVNVTANLARKEMTSRLVEVLNLED